MSTVSNSVDCKDKGVGRQCYACDNIGINGYNSFEPALTRYINIDPNYNIDGVLPVNGTLYLTKKRFKSTTLGCNFNFDLYTSKTFGNKSFDIYANYYDSNNYIKFTIGNFTTTNYDMLATDGTIISVPHYFYGLSYEVKIAGNIVKSGSKNGIHFGNDSVDSSGKLIDSRLDFLLQEYPYLNYYYYNEYNDYYNELTSLVYYGISNNVLTELHLFLDITATINSDGDTNWTFNCGTGFIELLNQQVISSSKLAFVSNGDFYISFQNKYLDPLEFNFSKVYNKVDDDPDIHRRGYIGNSSNDGDGYSANVPYIGIIDDYESPDAPLCFDGSTHFYNIYI